MSTIDSSGNIHKGSGLGGGQFSGRANSAPSRSLTGEALTASIDELLQRRAELIAAGFAPATAGPSTGSPRTAAGIDSWWEEHFRRAEVRDDVSYQQMPDDYTPKNTAGRSLGGKRRTHRVLYEGAGIALRMPSATAIKRYSKDLNGQTFDVPVQAEGAGGRVVSGYVRVTQEGPNAWSVNALGMPANVADKVGESVAALLESRRPSMALRSVGDLIERRRERIARRGTSLDSVENSSWIRAMGYNTAAGEMIITLGQRTYGYKVPQSAFEQTKNAYSPGAMYNRLVKGAPRVQIEQCPRCTRWFNGDTAHTCMSHLAPTSTVKPYNERVRAHVTMEAVGPA